MTTSAVIHGSNVHSVNALVSVSAGGPWYPDPRASPPDASAVPMPSRYRRRGQVEPPEPAWTGPMFMIATDLAQPVVPVLER